MFMDETKLWALEWVGPEPLSSTPMGMPLPQASSVTAPETPPLPRVVLKSNSILLCHAKLTVETQACSPALPPFSSAEGFSHPLKQLRMLSKEQGRVGEIQALSLWFSLLCGPVLPT